MDPKKRYALTAGLETSGSINRLGMKEILWTRGESYHAIKTPWGIMVGVPEGLGTKNEAAESMVARLEVARQVVSQLTECRQATGHLAQLASSLRRGYGQCNVAMNANDIITSGVSPAEFMMHADIGPGWINNNQRWIDLVDGTKHGCLLSGCCWGGGETAELNTLPPDTCTLSGMMCGFTNGELINPASIQDGDSLVAFGSSGPHSNGYTGLRDLSGKLSDGYLTIVPGTNKTFGELILAPTCIYVDVIERCLALGVRIHAIFNITGHALCKLMRPEQPHAYVVENLPHHPLFDFIQGVTGTDNKKMLKTFNCGVGTVIACPAEDVQKVLQAVAEMHDTHPGWHPFDAWKLGHIEASQARNVHIPTWNVSYGPEDLAIR